MASWKLFIASLLISTVIIIVFYGFALNQTSPSLFFSSAEVVTEVKKVPISTVIMTIAAMIFGIVFGALNEQLNGKDTITSFSSEFTTLLRSTRFFKALLASPVLFVGVYLASQTEPDIVVSLIFAFQNGFFCDAILKGKVAKK